MATEKFVSQIKRTHMCGELATTHEGQDVVVMGWVNARRDHGGLIFIDLRDRTGMVQIVINPSDPQCLVGKDLRAEFVVAFKGCVKKRPEDMINKKILTGAIEVEVHACEVLSQAETPPFQIGDDNVSESLRLKYRYLDLRNSTLQNHLIKRHQTQQLVRSKLTEMGFLEIETPILYKSTPEGARDYLVPSRVNQGQFYALPQSPQTLKQLLMISGYDRYFQLARCFRDEDLRADRQPEFTQIDIEMSFVDMDDVMASSEDLASSIWQQMKGESIGEVPKLSYHEAMNRFGCDKPDLRIPWELVDLSEWVADCDFKVFTDTIKRGGVVKALSVPGAGSYSRAQLDKLTHGVKNYGAKGLVWIKSSDKDELTSAVSKFFSEESLRELFVKSGGQKEAMVLIVADDFDVSSAALSYLRLHLAEVLGAIDKTKDRFLWVTDFPLFEHNKDNQRWVAKHHPFTAPHDEDVDKLVSGDDKVMGQIRAKAYDLVCNGNEIAGGSIRIHRQEVQQAMFKSLGLGPDEVKHKFGFFVEALKYGTPPHGGIAWGFDRIVMIISGTDAIREVIAFPKTAKATDLMAEAPSEVQREQLLELGIRLK